MAERVLGIDLGTTNSCVAVLDGGTPTIIANCGGYKTTPSVVAVSESGVERAQEAQLKAAARRQGRACRCGGTAQGC